METLKTTLSFTGVASSFIKDGNYIISTVKTPAGFETVFKTVGQYKTVICSIGSPSSKFAMDNHIAMTRMATSSNSDEWKKENIASFSPKVILEAVEKMNLDYDSTILDCEFCNQFLAMSGINYSKGSSDVPKFLKSAIGLFTITLGIRYGYKFASESEFNLFIVILSSITGAFIAIIINEEIYYRSRNLNKVMRLFWCFAGSFIGIIITIIFFAIIKNLLK